MSNFDDRPARPRSGFTKRGNDAGGDQPRFKPRGSRDGDDRNPARRPESSVWRADAGDQPAAKTPRGRTFSGKPVGERAPYGKDRGERKRSFDEGSPLPRRDRDSQERPRAPREGGWANGPRSSGPRFSNAGASNSGEGGSPWTQARQKRDLEVSDQAPRREFRPRNPDDRPQRSFPRRDDGGGFARRDDGGGFTRRGDGGNRPFGDREGFKGNRFKDRQPPIRPYGRMGEENTEENRTATPIPGAGEHKELRIYGKHAVLGVVKDRLEAIRKVYYHRSVQNAFGDLFSWCAANRVGYREVEMEDLARLAQTEHHEGVVAEIVRPSKSTLADLLPKLSEANHCLIILDGVGNPHNLGAILRNAAHFNAAAVVLTPGAQIDLSGAAYRVAEGGAEAQPLVQLQSLDELDQLTAAGFQLVAAHTRQAKSLWQSKLSAKCAFIFGAEGGGVSDALLEKAALKVLIPGSGKVESLNVAQSVAVLLAEWSRNRT